MYNVIRTNRCSSRQAHMPTSLAGKAYQEQTPRGVSPLGFAACYHRDARMVIDFKSAPALGFAACRSALPLSTEGTKEPQGRKKVRRKLLESFDDSNKNRIFAPKRDIEKAMASDKTQYVVALIAEFANHFGLTTAQAVKYLSKYKALELYDRQYGYMHTQSFASNVRDLSAYCRRMGGLSAIPIRILVRLFISLLRKVRQWILLLLG